MVKVVNTAAANGASADAPAKRQLVIDFPDLMPKRATVRFNSNVADPDVSSFYLMRKGWEALGAPDGIRVTIEPLT